MMRRFVVRADILDEAKASRQVGLAADVLDQAPLPAPDAGPSLCSGGQPHLNLRATRE
jgi:hypothetical protein